jgi:hypothetical protein
MKAGPLNGPAFYFPPDRHGSAAWVAPNAKPNPSTADWPIWINGNGQAVAINLPDSTASVPAPSDPRC